MIPSDSHFFRNRLLYSSSSPLSNYLLSTSTTSSSDSIDASSICSLQPTALLLTPPPESVTSVSSSSSASPSASFSGSPSSSSYSSASAAAAVVSLGALSRQLAPQSPPSLVAVPATSGHTVSSSTSSGAQNSSSTVSSVSTSPSSSPFTPTPSLPSLAVGQSPSAVHLQIPSTSSTSISTSSTSVTSSFLPSAAAAAAAAAAALNQHHHVFQQQSPSVHPASVLGLHPTSVVTTPVVTSGNSQSTAMDMDQLNKTLAGPATWPTNLALIMKAAAAGGAVASAAAAAAAVASSAAAAATTTEEASSSNGTAGPDMDKCWVCGCSANGRHYGVMACFGCKGFFRRSVQGGKNYVCRHEKNCVIDQNDRNCCRACRFEKCLTVGMDPAAIQPDRDKTGRQRNPRKSQYSSNRSYSNMNDRLNDGRESTPVSNGGSVDVTMSTVDQAIMNTLLEIETICREMKAEISTPYQNLETAVQKPSTVYSRTSVSFDGKMGPVSLKKLRDDVLRLCVLKLDYASTLRPLADVNVADKMVIIRQYLSPFMILEVGYQSSQHNDSDNIYLPSGHVITPNQLFFSEDSDDDKVRAIIEDKISSLRRNFLDQLVNQLRRLQITSSELAAVKAIMVLDPHAPGLSQDSIELLQSGREAVQRALFAHVQSRYSSEGSIRFAHLLMLITSVTRLSLQVVAFLQYLKESGIFSDTVFTDFFLHGW